MKSHLVIKNHLESFVKDYLDKAEKVEAPCQHFGDCGGCNFQDLSYETQLDLKKQKFLEILKVDDMEEEFEDAEIEVVGSPEIFNYRQRMDFGGSEEKFGLRRIRGKRIFDLQECHLMRDGAYDAFDRMRELAREAGLQGYDSYVHEGELRYLVVRQNKAGDRLLSLLTKTKNNEEAITKIAETLIAEGFAKSVHWLVNESLSDIAFGEEYRHWGEFYIDETFHGRTYLLGPNTFFQSNPHVAEKAYGLIREDLQRHGATELLDLYSGTCTIGIILSDLVEKITAVENWPANCEMALTNLKNNAVENVSYVSSDVADFMKTYEGDADYVVLNPPRTGVDEKTLRRLRQIKPKAIAYLSCNPISLVEDLGILSLGYDVEKVHILDMFPQTQHFETLVLLTKA